MTALFTAARTMADSEPLVSVVTPVYNGEKFLAECVDSVLSQTYRNFEYVIVENWSTDDSFEIANGFARLDERIRVIRPPAHLAMMPNWNFSVAQMNAESSYCKVVHADDWLKPRCVELMVEVAERHPGVGIVSAYRIEEDKPGMRGLPPNQEVFSGHEVGASALLGEVSVFGAPTQILMRADLVRGRKTFYDESLVHADKDACLRLLLDSDLGFISEVLSYTRRHNESNTSAVNTIQPRRIEDFILLQRYGAHYLGDDFERHWNRAVESYHRYLARRILTGRDTAFLEYHRAKRAEVGLDINRWRIARELFLLIGNLTDTARLLRRRLSARGSAVGSGS